MLLRLPREDGYGVIPRTKNGPTLAGYGAITMKNALAATMTTLPEQLRLSLTWDRGKELSAHKHFKVETGIPVYFADTQRRHLEQHRGCRRPRPLHDAQPAPRVFDRTPPTVPRVRLGSATRLLDRNRRRRELLRARWCVMAEWRQGPAGPPAPRGRSRRGPRIGPLRRRSARRPGRAREYGTAESPRLCHHDDILRIFPPRNRFPQGDRVAIDSEQTNRRRSENHG